MIILKRILNNKRAGWEKKLLALISLAHMASKESIGVLRAYYRNPDPEMRYYAKLALNEAEYLAQARRR
jgi:hypothetical protein